MRNIIDPELPRPRDIDWDAALGPLLKSVSAAVILLDGARRVVAANPIAAAILNAGDPFIVDCNGVLQVSLPADAAGFALAFASPQIEDGAHAARIARVRVVDGTRAYLARIVTCSDAASSTAEPIHPLSPHATHLVLLTPLDGAVMIPAVAIKTAFDLTLAEARLVTALVAGETLEGFAERTGHSRNTVRNQLAAIFAKTGTRRQAELVARVVVALAPVAVRD